MIKKSRLNINKEKFTELIKNDLKNDKMSEELKITIYEISKNLLNKNNFRGYIDIMKDEMEFLAYENINKYWKNFNPEQGNAFSYINKIIFRSFITIINKYKLKEFGILYFYEDYVNLNTEDEDKKINNFFVNYKMNLNRSNNIFYDRIELIDIILNNLEENQKKEDIIFLFSKIDENKKIKEYIKKDKTFEFIFNNIKF